ncbi:MAG TPA: pyridoxal-dependent decarboxylase [Longimicrobiales bacterium]
MSDDSRPELEPRPEEGLDPEDWEALRALGHRMVDDVISFHRGLSERPAWQPLPESVREALRRPPPETGEGAERAYEEFREHVLPYPFGNVHPRGWGWVNGTGTTLAAFAEMLAAAMNSNVWGGEHAAAYVEAQVLDWAKRAVGYPGDASGVLTTGGSVANLIGLAAAREARGGGDVSARGLRALPEPLVVYASEQAHNSVDKAAGLLGIGWDGLRKIPTDLDFRMDIAALEAAIAEDRAAGRRPVCVVGTAGTVNTGAIDDLDRLADVCAREGLWLHVDGAIGALAALSPALRRQLRGIERADSIAFDLHKWLHIPIEAGCVLVRDGAWHRRPFSPPASYLAWLDRGLSSGPYGYLDLGPQLTRSFRALKVWMSLKAHGTGTFARLIEQNVRQARHLETRIREHPRLELLAPVPLNIVCFRYRPDGASDRATRAASGAAAPAADAAPEIDALNRELLMRLQESGVAVPSSTIIDGTFALRVALTNHRTRTADLDALVDAVVAIGDALVREPAWSAGLAPADGA